MDRYHRQTILPGFGPDAAARLAGAHAMIVGCGALGCPAADLLARAGVGRISLIDRDVVELTNLQRQTLFDERDAADGAPKAVAAARRLALVNSSVRVEAIVEDFAGRDAERIVSASPRPGVLLDCTDNFQTRYLLNDVAVKLGVPLVYGGAVGTGGMTLTILPGLTACLRCFFPEPPPPGSAPTCDTAGILGPVAAVVGARQACEAIKVLIGRTASAARGVWAFDAWANSERRIGAGAGDPSGGRRADCPCCGEGGRFEFLDRDTDDDARVLCGRDSVQVSPAAGDSPRRPTVDLGVLRARLDAGGAGRFALGEHHLRGRLGGAGPDAGLEITVFRDGRAIIAGTTDPVLARAVYARYIGA